MSVVDFRNLPPVLQVYIAPNTKRPTRCAPTACDVAQTGKSTMWEWIADGKVEVIRGPRFVRVKTASLLRYLGVGDNPQSAQ